MMSPLRPRRSVLYMPGSNARALEKGKTLPADALIFDLEDAVAPDAKSLARQQVVAALETGDYGHREIIIRMNGLKTDWGSQDLEAIAGSKADALLVPKVESAAQIQEIESLMQSAGANAEMAIWAMMETPLGMLHAEEIAAASKRLTCLVMGTSDLAKETNALHTRDRLPMITSLGLCLLAARAHGLTTLDGVHLNLDDDEGFAFSCQQGLELGFDGKTLIHPKTIAKTNEVFAPSEAQVDRSQQIVEAFEQAQLEGKGVVLLDGKLVENLHVETAKKTLALDKAIRRSNTHHD